MNAAKKSGLIFGIIAAAFILLFTDLDPSNPQITRMAAIAVLMAVWWITEAIPLATTSLIPLILFPVFGILKSDEIASSYINSIIFLFLGGFMIALAMERWGLHKRIALKVITLFGGSPHSIVFGFMVSAGFLSMWISNTATAIMMLPIAIAIISRMENQFGKESTHNFTLTLLLGVAYACTLGGMATLVGTPPNLVFVKTLNIMFPDAPEISFGNWMIMALPITLIMIFVMSLILTKVIYKFDRSLKVDSEFIKEEYLKLGKMSFEEKAVSIVFTLTALLWILRTDINFGIFNIYGWSNIFSYSNFINDGTVAITMAFILFLIPSKNERTRLLTNEVFAKIPWGIILLFGGGFALAKGFAVTGLSLYIGEQLSGLSSLPHFIMIIIVATTISFLTELTSNTATTQMILPILASVSIAMGMNPMLLMLTATLSASMAFMLPVATPPNTIIFASGRIKIFEMAKSGIALNMIGIIVVSIIVYFLGTMIFDLGTMPNWAVAR
ncbi:MAG: SLC13/DASS family transporter [Bacteroidetes bacterium]|nr:SLC13/DASS family transporter [Bacteroidota bacterium]